MNHSHSNNVLSALSFFLVCWVVVPMALRVCWELAKVGWTFFGLVP